MKPILFRYLVVLGFFAAAALALDFFNFPLSPINFLNRLYPVDLGVRIVGVPAETASEWLAAEGGAEVVLRDRGGEELDRRSTDPRGRLRLHLHAGSYLVLGTLAVQSGPQVEFYETAGPLGLEVTGRKLLGIVELGRSERVDAQRLLGYLEKLLGRGELDRALAIGQQLNAKSVDGLETVEGKLAEMRRRLGEGLVQVQALQQLPPGSYNSSILVLERLEQVVAELTGTNRELTVRFGGDHFDPAGRRRSMIEARDAILASRLDVAEQALRARSFVEALVEFRAVLSDPELWRQGQETSDDVRQRVEMYEAGRPELVDAVQTELLGQLGRGIERYNAGDLDKAQTELIGVATGLQRLRGELEMHEAEQSAAAYLRDIESIVRAGGLEKQEKWYEALTAYTAVTNVNPIVRQGIIEARSRATGLQPAEPTPALPSDL